MTPAREAIVLPAIFLTVALLGGFRAAESIRLLPPSLTALVLAFLLTGTLVRGGALLPQALLNGNRSGMENTSGTVLLLALFAASAQAINLVLPERGLLHAAFAIFLFCQLLALNAARTDRGGTLRTLLVLFGSLFVLRYIVVEALYAPERGLLHRVLTALMSGATLGGIVYEPNQPITGYVAFLALVLYVIGLVLLPSAPGTSEMIRRHPPASSLPTVVSTVLVLFAVSGCRGAEPPAATGKADPGAGQASAAPAPAKPGAGPVSARVRAAALERAQVWMAPGTPIDRANLKANPPGDGTFEESDVVECRLVIKAMSGTTPKFDCEQKDGDVIRVKYGRGNPELHAEVATTRLLSALGFGADRMYVVGKVRCSGCPLFPFQALRCLAETGLERACFPRGVNHTGVTEFEHAVIERRLEGRRIESTPDQGWAWYEIDQISASAGGAPRAHVDALKLFAVLIAHWDNKAENQRLICLPGGDLPDGGCTRPLAMIQDLGASFGPVKVDLHNWRSTGVWTDPRTCAVSMENLPWGGATFPAQRISEEGRLFLLTLLEKLSIRQLEDLFSGARIEHLEGIGAESRQPRAWAAAFQDKIRQIRDAGPCAATPNS
jgi:hypothetical protein